MVFAVGAGNDYANGHSGQSMENATAEIKAADHPDMRVWFVPSIKKNVVSVSPSDPRSKLGYVKENNGKIYVGQDTPQARLSGSCNMSKMCSNLLDPLNGNCANECHDTDTDLLQQDWNVLSPQNVGPLSAVCYVAIRNTKMKAHPERPVGILASYVGGTPVGCWANDMHGDETCKVSADPNKQVPCDRKTACCPGMLYNDKIAPLLPFNVKAALWYQGEANTDEGYTRTREEYACQMKLLVNTWRSAWGYTIPFFWMQLHGWGPGGGASDNVCMWGGGPFIHPMNCQYSVRLAQNDAALALPMAAMSSAIDGCQLDSPRATASTCNLHPGFKTVPGTRMGQDMMNMLFKGDEPQAPTLEGAKYTLSAAGDSIVVEWAMGQSDGLHLQPINDYEKIWGGIGCSGGAMGMAVLNVTLGDDPKPVYLNGTSAVVGGQLESTWTSPFYNELGVVGTQVTKVFGVHYLTNTVPTCVVANAGGRPLGPQLHPF